MNCPLSPVHNLRSEKVAPRPFVILLTIAMSFLATDNARAALVTWRVSGTIADWANSGETLPFTGGVGDAYTADFTFDTEAEERIASAGDPYVASYHGAITNVAFRLNGLEATLSYPEGFRTIYVLNDREVQGESGYWDQVTFATRSASGDPAVVAGMQFLTSSMERPVSPLNSTAIPNDPALLMQFSERYAYFVSFDPNDYLIGNISSITAVPLPATAPLLAVGLAMLRVFGVRRRTGRKRQDDPVATQK